MFIHFRNFLIHHSPSHYLHHDHPLRWNSTVPCRFCVPFRFHSRCSFSTCVFENCTHAVWSFHAVSEWEWNIEHSKSFSVNLFCILKDENHLFKSHLSRKHMKMYFQKSLNWNLLSIHMIMKLHMFHSDSISLQRLTRGFCINLFIISGLILNYPTHSSQQRSKRDEEGNKNMFVISSICQQTCSIEFTSNMRFREHFVDYGEFTSGSSSKWRKSRRIYESSPKLRKNSLVYISFFRHFRNQNDQKIARMFHNFGERTMTSIYCVIFSMRLYVPKGSRTRHDAAADKFPIQIFLFWFFFASLIVAIVWT